MLSRRTLTVSVKNCPTHGAYTAMFSNGARTGTHSTVVRRLSLTRWVLHWARAVCCVAWRLTFNRERPIRRPFPQSIGLPYLLLRFPSGQNLPLIPFTRHRRVKICRRVGCDLDWKPSHRHVLDHEFQRQNRISGQHPHSLGPCPVPWAVLLADTEAGSGLASDAVGTVP